MKYLDPKRALERKTLNAALHAHCLRAKCLHNVFVDGNGMLSDFSAEVQKRDYFQKAPFGRSAMMTILFPLWHYLALVQATHL